MKQVVLDCHLYLIMKRLYLVESLLYLLDDLHYMELVQHQFGKVVPKVGFDSLNPPGML
jgi:hypothetical protein